MRRRELGRLRKKYQELYRNIECVDQLNHLRGRLVRTHDPTVREKIRRQICALHCIGRVESLLPRPHPFEALLETCKRLR